MKRIYAPSKIKPFDSEEEARFLGRLADTCRDVLVAPIGESVLSVPILSVSLGSGKRTVLYVGTHHAMEWITSVVLCDFLADLCRAARSGGSVCGVNVMELLRDTRLCFVPMLNPDGTDFAIHGLPKNHPLSPRVLKMNRGNPDFSRWQANARGVDLNHNYDAGFAEYSRLAAEEGITDGAPTRYAGLYPFSEPEVQALTNLTYFLPGLCGVMTLHTQGEEIYYRSGDAVLPGSESVARRLARDTGFTLSVASGLASYGGLTDWCVQKRGIPSFTLECGRGVNPLPLSDADGIYLKIRKGLFRFPGYVTKPSGG